MKRKGTHLPFVTWEASTLRLHSLGTSLHSRPDLCGVGALSGDSSASSALAPPGLPPLFSSGPGRWDLAWAAYGAGQSLGGFPGGVGAQELGLEEALREHAGRRRAARDRSPPGGGGKRKKVPAEQTVSPETKEARETGAANPWGPLLLQSAEAERRLPWAKPKCLPRKRPARYTLRRCLQRC